MDAPYRIRRLSDSPGASGTDVPSLEKIIKHYASSLFEVGCNEPPWAVKLCFSVRLSGVFLSWPDHREAPRAVAVKDGRRPSRSGAQRP
jgi:hypothetical protein